MIAFRRDVSYNELNLSKLQYMIEMGRLDASKKITLKELAESGACGKIKDGVKLLAGVKQK